jgi:DNA gyrase subunit B
MPELVERGHIYIAQPPLYKVKFGKDEQYLKDGHELDAYLMRVALRDARLETGNAAANGATTLEGETLEALARQYVLAKNVVDRLANWMDVDSLRAMANGLAIDLDTLEAAEASARALAAVLRDAEVTAEFDVRTDKHVLRIGRMHHGNVKSSVITADFVHGADYEALSTAGRTFKGLVGPGAIVKRGEGDRQKEAKVGDFREAMAWLLQQAESAVARQRYKGLGEMNPEQLWDTTMNPATRTLLQVSLDDALGAEEAFVNLMGDQVEPRKEFIQRHARDVRFLDI